ncbi:hypothetical protein QF030_000401 [Streptomyces rishiriensis]|uniref:Uncharacterized protein n=1 Tax=Streptomyces rishiriensis TaxID=68264 RepID=A0ABU0NGJ7_STRRH|nr:hypothetical protein [Streptomyces rishiriensis]
MKDDEMASALYAADFDIDPETKRAILPPQQTSVPLSIRLHSSTIRSGKLNSALGPRSKTAAEFKGFRTQQDATGRWGLAQDTPRTEQGISDRNFADAVRAADFMIDPATGRPVLPTARSSSLAAHLHSALPGANGIKTGLKPHTIQALRDQGFHIQPSGGKWGLADDTPRWGDGKQWITRAEFMRRQSTTESGITIPVDIATGRIQALAAAALSAENSRALAAPRERQAPGPGQGSYGPAAPRRESGVPLPSIAALERSGHLPFRDFTAAAAAQVAGVTPRSTQSQHPTAESGPYPNYPSQTQRAPGQQR